MPLTAPTQRKEREKKKFEKEYLASLSRSVKDAKTADYISSRTVNGADVLDPTGRTFKIEPSQVTAIKPQGFGLGKTRGDIVDKVRCTPALSCEECVSTLCISMGAAVVSYRVVRLHLVAQIATKSIHKTVQFDPRFVPKVMLAWWLGTWCASRIELHIL